MNNQNAKRYPGTSTTPDKIKLMYTLPPKLPIFIEIPNIPDKLQTLARKKESNRLNIHGMIGCSKVYSAQIFEFFTIGLSDAFLSDYLTVLKLHKTKINFIKNCPQWGLNSQPPDIVMLY